VRQAGVVDSARGLDLCSHVGWGYAGRVELRTRAWEYLLDGVAAGQRIEFVGSGTVQALRAEVAGFTDGDPNFGQNAIDQGAFRVALVDDVYAFSGAGRVVDPDRSAAARAAATVDALAAGYTGLRAVVDATALAGEVDCSSAVQFADTLGRVLPLAPGPELVVDGRELEFIDHRGLLVLDRCAGQLGLHLAMQTHRQTAAHIAEAMGLQHLRVDVLA